MHRPPPLLCASLRVVSPWLLSLCKCLVVFCAWFKRCPKLLLTPESSNRSVLELVLHANSCNSNRSVRPRERWVTSAYATWSRLQSIPGVQATLLMLVLHLLVQRSCGILKTTWGCRKARFQRQWHHGVSSLRSTRRRFSCGIVQEKLCGMDPKPPSRGVLHAYVFFFTLPEPHLFCLAFAGSTSGRSCGDNEIIGGAMKLSAGGVRFMPRAKAEHTRALTIGLLQATSVFQYVQKGAHADGA